MYNFPRIKCKKGMVFFLYKLGYTDYVILAVLCGFYEND